ncbi:angiopoietin-related protein 7-like [Ylistrum balloti]|uniref:angiopoietin-related protein 7-like n=1 Tax=Ylistrum balloti TaxID=509963 RepID=UPI002905E529|nr:angiopoietin-related protein 7-like [Ylistrum balloti]
MYFSKVFSDCSKIPNGFPSGVYRITTTQGNVFDALCDMETAGGPWTVIQNRINEEEDFYRNWSDYKSGFGDLYGSFWIGNDILHLLTRTPRILRVELKVWNGVKGYAHYSTFQVANEDQNYTLLVNGLSGNITSDAMDKDDGIAFSTFDRDNDENPDFNIAEMRQSGWWHKAQNGTKANLNGRLLSDKKEPKKAMTWVRFPDQNIFYMPLKTTRMLIQ